MNEKTYRVLEYDKIKELLREEAASLMTRKVIEELLPSQNEYEIREDSGNHGSGFRYYEKARCRWAGFMILKDG